jgi:hypothetical protein
MSEELKDGELIETSGGVEIFRDTNGNRCARPTQEGEFIVVEGTRFRAERDPHGSPQLVWVPHSFNPLTGNVDPLHDRAVFMLRINDRQIVRVDGDTELLDRPI